MPTTQITRIQTMEQAFHAASTALATLSAALADYEATLPLFEQLQEYYESPLWLADYDADHAGRLPAHLPRGILSEDALYDLLSDHDHLRHCLQEICKERMTHA